MTKQEFQQKHGEWEKFNTQDVLMRIASNLSDTQEMLYMGMDANEHLNNVKRYIFDYMTVLRIEEQNARYEAQEREEFNSHLG